MEKDLLTDRAKATGRKGLSIESIFRCMLLKQITGVSYKMLAFHLADSYSYRTFARLDRDCEPGKSVLSRYFVKSRDCTGVKLRLTDHRKKSRSLAAAIFYGKKAKKDELYEELILLAMKVIGQSDKATEQVKQQCECDMLSQPWIEAVIHYRA